MKKLLKQYEFNSDMQYFQYIVDSRINGQRLQSIDLFLAMPKRYKKMFLISAMTYWESGLDMTQLANYLDLM
jgi:hypothetical protein